MPTTISGNIKNLATAAVGSSQNALVRFILRGTGQAQPVITGTGAIAPTSANGIWYTDLAADANGAVSETIYSTRDNAGTGAGDITVSGSGTAVYYDMQIIANGMSGPSVSVHAKNGATLDPSNVTPITTLPVVTAPTGDSTYARLDGGNTPFTGLAQFNAGILATSAKPDTDDTRPLGDSTHRWTASLGTVTTKSIDGSVFNAKGFGCKGDGSTDDTANLLLALRSADAQYNTIDTSQVGRVTFLPEGTYIINNPLYLRKGDVLRGCGATATIIKAGTSFPANQPLVYMGFKSDGTQDSGGLEPVVEGIFFENPATSGNGVQTYSGTSRVSGWSIKDCWFNCNIGILAAGTDGLISRCVIDGALTGIQILGDGASYGVTHSIIVEGCRIFKPTFAGIHIDGANDIQIIGNYFDYCKQYGIYFDNTGSSGTSYNIRILGNHFTTSSSSSFYTATQTDIDLEWPLENVEVCGNSFSRSRKAAINFGNASVKNVTCSCNQYQDTNDTAILVGGCGAGVRFINETFRNIGNYSIDATGGVVIIRDCYSTGNFAVAGLPVNDYDKAAFRIQNASGAGSIVSDCSTDATTYAVAALRSGVTSAYTSNNHSGWATADVYYNAGSGSFNSVNERLVNAGGAVSLITSTLPVVSNYNAIATVSNGIPSEYATVDLTAQTAAIATTTLYAVPSGGAGQYRVNWNAKVTTAAGVTSTLGALTITYTDPDGVPQTITAGAQSSAGAIETTDTGNSTTAKLIGLPMLINAKASTNIQYAFAYASNAANAMNYNLHIKLEAL